MSQRTAKDVMTAPVHTVSANTPLEQVVQLLASHHISGVPVVDEQEQVVGFVTEADLIDEHKREARIPRTALYGFFLLPDDVLRDAARRGKSMTAGDLMSRNVITAREETPVHALADLMVEHRINRVPIVRDGRLVGIVARADLVRDLARP